MIWIRCFDSNKLVCTGTSQISLKKKQHLVVTLYQGYAGDPTCVHCFFELRPPEVGQLEFFNDGVGLVDNLIAGLSMGTKPCFLPIVPHAPCNCDDLLKQIPSHVLHNDKIPDEVYKVPVVYTSIIKRYTCCCAIPKKKCPQLVSTAKPQASQVGSSSSLRWQRFTLVRQNIMACFPSKSIQFFWDIETPDGPPKQVLIMIV